MALQLYKNQMVILLDDIIRLNLDAIFSIFTYHKIEAYTFKFTRDAELNLDDDIAISLKEKVEHSIKLRKKGAPVRFVYDQDMPHDLLEYLLKNLNLEFGVNTIAGGIYTKMITSATGLIIGLIAYVGHNYLTTQIDKTANKMETASADFLDILQEPTHS